MPIDRSKFKKIITITLAVLFIIAALGVGFYITRRDSSNDLRDKAAVTALETVSLSLSPAQIQTNPSSSFEVNVMMNSTTAISAVAFRVKYPKNVVAVNKLATENAQTQANTACRAQNFKLDTVLNVSIDEVNGIVSISKVGIKSQSELPSGTFCVTTITFTTNTTTTQYDEISLHDTASWEVAGLNANGYNPTLSLTNAKTTLKVARCNINGDADCRNGVSLADFEIWRKEYKRELTTTTADFTGSGGIPDRVVNLSDFEVWRSNYKK